MSKHFLCEDCKWYREDTLPEEMAKAHPWVFTWHFCELLRALSEDKGDVLLTVREEIQRTSARDYIDGKTMQCRGFEAKK